MCVPACVSMATDRYYVGRPIVDSNGGNQLYFIALNNSKQFGTISTKHTGPMNFIFEGQGLFRNEQ